MADEEAEKKNISKLDFNINDAINSLSKIDEKLKSISNSSEAYAKKIGSNINSSFDFSKTIDTKSLQSNLKNVSTLSKKSLNDINTTMIKEGIKTSEKEKRLSADVAAFKEKQSAKSTQRIIKDNEKQRQSAQTLSDKISQYAKTYLIYQGFNQLKTVVRETIDEMVDIEYQMVQIDRVMNVSGLNIDNFRDKLIQLAYDYGNSFDNVADISLRLAQAGIKENANLALTEKTLLALNTAELNATQATSDMVAVMSQWGLITEDSTKQAKDYGEIIDKINKVADNFPTTSEDILNALKKTSSAFNLAGASIDETIATIVAAEKASQRGGKVIGTALANITQQLKAEGKLDLAEELGLDFFTDAKKTQFKPIMEIFQEMSERMEALKNEGKENSIEMQNLLEMFTVFRRNIGASLLGEMAGEDSTYAQVLKTSINSVGYSLSENAKHMQTAKAAQAQFNAELLKLKTEVWDGGVEGVFRDMLNFGTDLVKGISNLIDKFGLLPTSIGAVTLAFSLLNKSTQASNWTSAANSVKQINQLYKNTANGIQDVSKYQENYNTILNNSSKSFIAYSKTIPKGTQSLGGYIKYLTVSTTKTILLTAKTILLQAAISGGITLAITFLTSKINDVIHAEEKFIEKTEESMQISKDNASEIDNEIKELENLRKEYENLVKKKKRTPDEENKIYELQEQINSLIKDSGTKVDLVTKKIDEQGNSVLEVNKAYDKQLETLKAIEYQKKKLEVGELKKAAEDAQKILDEINASAIQGNLWEGLMGGPSMARAFVKAGISEEKKTIWGDISDISINPQMYDFAHSDFQKQIQLLEEWIIKLEAVNDGNEDVSKTLTKLQSALKNVKERYNTAKDATEKYKNALSELYAMSGQVDTFNTFLSSIQESYDIDKMKGPKQLILDLKALNKQFSDGKIDVEEYFDAIQKKIKDIDLSAQGEELEAYQAIFAATTESLAEGISSLNSGLESNTINFADYTEGLTEAGEGLLDLYVKQNNLHLEDDKWLDASNNVNEYANSLQNAINKLDGMSGILEVVGDNYDYIAEHANSAGEAAFTQADRSSKSYQKLANDFANSLNQMKNTNAEAYNAITNKIYESMGKSANEVTNADKYIVDTLNSNNKALSAGLNEAAVQAARANGDLTVSMGDVLSALGTAISNFDYNIKATPYISGSLGIHTNAQGVPDGISLPTFGFDITGSGGTSVQNLGKALSSFGKNLVSSGAQKYSYTPLQTTGGTYQGTGGTGGTGGTKKTGGTGGTKKTGGGSSKADAEKAAKEEYKAKLDAFKDFVSERERLEQRWVSKEKELGLLSTKDYLYITQQRIKRYQQYLAKVKKMTWLNKEDRVALEKEYKEKIEDLQVDYLGYLKDKLDEQIDALKEANEKKIDLIKEEADERIAALRKVEDENDRIRAKEEYLKKRQEHLDDISYWEQRTGREAQEALLEARKNLKELDEEWKQQLEDWSIEDQIKAIEEERDAQIAAIEEAQQKQIDAWTKTYEARVKLFGETGKIIYDNTVIQSKNLYNAYKKNFVDPLSKDLANINKTKTKSSSSTKKEYDSYKIKSGDTLSAIAKKYNTTVSKIMAANPSIKNKNLIYAGKTIKIPKFHEGGIVGGNKEGFALLKPNEVVLKPSWSASLDRMMNYFDNLSSNNRTSIANGPTINVDGDLIKVEASIKNQSDINKLEKKLEKMLKDKFNIKK